MLKKLLLLSLVNVAILSAAAPTIADPTFPQKMEQAIQNAENEVQQLQTNATRQDTVPMWSDKLQLENAIIQLEVKKTLVNNFRNSASIQSPIVREKLLEMLNRDITQADLAELQSLVNQVKGTLNSAPGATGL